MEKTLALASDRKGGYPYIWRTSETEDEGGCRYGRQAEGLISRTASLVVHRIDQYFWTTLHV